MDANMKVKLRTFIGINSAHDPEERRLLQPDEEFFQLENNSNIWSKLYKEKAVPFKVFKKNCSVKRTEDRDMIYIQPIGNEFVDIDGIRSDRAPNLRHVQRFCEAYFYPCSVTLLPSYSMNVVSSDAVRLSSEGSGFECACRTFADGSISLNADSLKAALRRQKQRLNKCLVIVGLTLNRLHSSHGAILGEATLSSGAALVRAYGYSKIRLQDTPLVNFRRLCQVLGHEISHALGLDHCTHFLCGMSGAIDVEENDGLPLHMCPACLHKLKHVLGCRLVERYAALLAFYEGCAAFEGDADWVRRRLQR